MMIDPRGYELERLWTRDNITHPSLSCETAEATFIKHFQRGNYMTVVVCYILNVLKCPEETIKEYTRRFQTLMIQLHYSNLDVQTIYHSIEWLHRNIQQKLSQYKIAGRTVGNCPANPRPLQPR